LSNYMYKPDKHPNPSSTHKTNQGVMMPEACGGYGYNDLDHCVQMVGFNDTAPEPYFKVGAFPMRFLPVALV
jgi:hypothetical protein